jgi:branched-chain amino acid transport system permease protein
MLMASIVDGIVVGCIYALIAAGFTVVFNATETVNFAVGESLTIGAYLLLTFAKFWAWPYWAAVVATLGVAGLLGYVVFDRLLSRPMIKAPLLSRVIALMGLAAVIKGCVRIVWGADAYHLQSAFSSRPIAIGSARITLNEVAIVGITAAVVIGLFLFYRYTRLGKAMRATSQNRRGAALMGINVAGIFAAAWIIGTMLSALGGVLLGPLLLIDPDMGSIVFKSFTAVVLGGFGSMPGAIVGGILLGVIENLVSAYIRTDLQVIATFVLLILVLAVKPTGLMGQPLVRRV